MPGEELCCRRMNISMVVVVQCFCSNICVHESTRETPPPPSAHPFLYNKKTPGVCLSTFRGGGYPIQPTGGTPSGQWGAPVRNGWGYPPVRIIWGSPIRTGWGTPPPQNRNWMWVPPPSQIRTGCSFMKLQNVYILFKVLFFFIGIFYGKIVLQFEC